MPNLDNKLSSEVNMIGRTTGETKSCNSYYWGSLSEPERKILNLIDSSDLELTPKEIASKIGINHNTCKVYCRKLEKESFIVRKFRGHYVSRRNLVTFREGMGVGGGVSGGPRVHWFQLRIGGLGGCGRGSEVVAENLCYRVKFVWSGNGTVLVDVGSKEVFSGFDYAGLRAVCDFVLAKLGVSDYSNVWFVNWHLNKDFEGVVLKGVRELQFRAFDDVFVRFYNKDDRLRVEVPKKENLTVAQAFDVLEKGGISHHGLIQSIFMQSKSVEKLVQVQKYRNEQTDRIIREFVRIGQAILEALPRLQREE